MPKFPLQFIPIDLPLVTPLIERERKQMVTVCRAQPAVGGETLIRSDWRDSTGQQADAILAESDPV